VAGGQLAAAFFDSWPGRYPDVATLDDALDLALTQAKQAWPEIDADAAAFVTFLGARVEGEADPVQALQALHVDDLYLAFACASGDEGALAAFERTHLHDLGVVARVDSSPAFVDEVRQRLRVHLFVGSEPKIREYGGRGSLAGWVRVCSMRLAQMMRRGARREQLDDEPESDRLALAAADPELALIKRKYGREFTEAVAASVLALDGRGRTVLKLNVLDRLNIDKIGGLYGVHRATVASWIAAARRAILDGTRQRLQEKLGLDVSELESLLGVVRSELDVRLSQLL
jgi:RNA polymerase sigma-70 factor (ECF subfamily)